MVKRDILSVLDMRNDLERIVDLGLQFKRSRYSEIPPSMKNRVLGMIFEKPSTRTRISLETAMVQMGGHAIYLNPNDMQMGRGERPSRTPPGSFPASWTPYLTGPSATRTSQG